MASSFYGPHRLLGAGVTHLEGDERLEDAIELLIHNLERPLHLVKGKGVRRHERGIDALHLQHAQEAGHA